MKSAAMKREMMAARRVAAALLAVAASEPTLAQDYPSRPVTIVLTPAPGPAWSNYGTATGGGTGMPFAVSTARSRSG
ncbi:MAG: hypothetical protein ACJ8FV_01760 [Xanthobacteraceae bacterium]